jgi:hypothetical protein
MLKNFYKNPLAKLRKSLSSILQGLVRASGSKSNRRPLWIEPLESRDLLTVSPALLNSWFVSGQGETAQIYQGVNGGTVSGPLTTWTNGTQTQSTAVLGDVHKVQYSTNGNYVYVTTPDLASYTMGPWWSDSTDQHPFINLPTNQNSIFRIAYNSTYPSATHANTAGGPVGIAVNGVVFYNAGDAFSYSHASGADSPQSGGDGIWNRMAEWAESATFDQGDGHQPGNGQYHYHTDPPALRAQLNDNIDYLGSTDFFPYDPMVYYLTHDEGTDATYTEHTANLHHSPIIGWMFDGYPIYGPYGYSDPTNLTSPVTRMVSSFSLRTDLTTGSPRNSVPGWSAELDGAKLGATAATTAPDAFYTFTAAQQASYAGPAVSATYPLGRYGEDYAYVPGSGTLDQFNGRWCVTPEFPNGTYAYFDTIDASGKPVFPYIINRQYYGGAPLNGSGKVTSITETVTTSFDVAVNTAPTVAGPATATVANGGKLSFMGASLIAVSDIDAAAIENVTLTIDAGTINVNRTGVLASRTSITAGDSDSSTLTLSGALSELNAALGTLKVTAPMRGTTARLTVQANDGSASNNVSNALTVTISLTDTAPTVTAPSTASVSANTVFAFASGSNLITVSDPDSLYETLLLSASAGTLTVMPGTTTVSGNSSSAVTIAGSPNDVNTVLSSLIFSAPSTGTSATITVQADDGSLTSNLATIALTILVVNNPPVFTKGPDETATDEGPAQVIIGWATNIAPGPPTAPDEANQTVQFILTNDNPDLFASQPAINSKGDLSYTPKRNVHGVAIVKVLLKDNGGGADISDPQQFAITIDKPHPFFNAAETGARAGCDVTGSTSATPDGLIVSGDVLAIINYINAHRSGEIPPSTFGPPYYDVTADNHIAADDVLSVINYINAHGSDGETSDEQVLATNVPKRDVVLNQTTTSSSSATSFDELLTSVAADVLESASNRRRI